MKMGYYQHRATLTIPAQVSCLTCVEHRQLLVGSDDGSVRLYDLDTLKVLKAIRGLGPVASVVLQPKSLSSHLWVASRRQAIQFSLKTDKLFLTPSDALQTLELGADGNDDLGELCVDAKGRKMAFCTDSGLVGVVDLQTNVITRMKQNHDNVCGSVCFIPGRPSELISGGYDYTMLHFDFMQGSVLSRDGLSALQPSGVSLSPPFILSLAISSTEIVAAGTADGRLYIGTGGEKSSDASDGRQRRQRHWKGLSTDGRIIVNVADGPVVALTFITPRELLACTLLGKVTQYQIRGSAAGSTLKLEPQWKDDSQDSHKANAIAFSGGSMIIGGFQKDGTGTVEVWTTCRD